MNRFTKVCLVSIIFLLAVIAVRPIVSPQAAVAASHYQYLVVGTQTPDTNEIQAELNRRVGDGWELAAEVVTEQRAGVILIFRKAAS